MNKIKISTDIPGEYTTGFIPGVEENKKSIEENLKRIQENQLIIQENQKRISENKEEIEKLREEYRWLSESSQARLERINKRLYIIIIILIGLLAGTNIAWIYSVDNMLIKIIIYISGLIGGFIIGVLTGVEYDKRTKDSVLKEIPGREAENKDNRINA